MVLVVTYLRAVIGAIAVVPLTLLISFCAIFFGLSGQTKKSDRVVVCWAKCILFLFGVKKNVFGEERLPDHGGGILLFNHQSHIDIPVLMDSTSKTIRFGAKIELFRIPFFGMAMRAIGTLPIARNNRREVMEIYQEASQRFSENMIYVLAPEGTRQSRPQIGKFKRGPFQFAIQAQVPVIPVVLRGAFDVNPKNRLLPNIGAWSRTVEVEFLDPISTSGLNDQDLDSLVERTRNQMVECFGKCK